MALASHCSQFTALILVLLGISTICSRYQGDLVLHGPELKQVVQVLQGLIGPHDQGVDFLLHLVIKATHGLHRVPAERGKKLH